MGLSPPKLPMATGLFWMLGTQRYKSAFSKRLKKIIITSELRVNNCKWEAKTTDPTLATGVQ